MDDIVVLLAGDDAGHDGVVVDLFLQIVGIAPGKFDTAEVVGESVGEIGVDVVAQGVVCSGVMRSPRRWRT